WNLCGCTLLKQPEPREIPARHSPPAAWCDLAVWRGSSCKVAVLSETPTEELEPCKHARQPEIRRPPLHPPPRSHRSVKPCWKASARASSSSTRMVGCCTPTNGPVASSTRSLGTAAGVAAKSWAGGSSRSAGAVGRL